jgi:hypothetical protein
VYTKFTDIVSKEASDTLLLHRSYNYRIKLRGLNTLEYSLLYKITTLELKETKHYLLDNLHKGFIVPS